MGRELLVPVDGSEASWKALEYAFDHHTADRITVLYVVDPVKGDYQLDETASDSVKQSDAVTREARERIHDAGLEETEVEVVTTEGKPKHEIIDYAEREGIDQIVMGSRGRSGVKRILLGSVAETVVRRSDTPVNIVR